MTSTKTRAAALGAEGWFTLDEAEPHLLGLRCTTCGNLTRFDVVATRRTKEFHHYSVGGELTVESSELLDEEIESVTCRWCSTGSGVVVVDDPEA